MLQSRSLVDVSRASIKVQLLNDLVFLVDLAKVVLDRCFGVCVESPGPVLKYLVYRRIPTAARSIPGIDTWLYRKRSRITAGNGLPHHH